MKWLRECLEALKNSTVRTNVIIIDNGSKDGTIDFIKREYPEIHLIEAENNLGFGQANNKGIRLAMDEGCDAVFLLNQDAYVYPDMFENLIKVASDPDNKHYGIFSPLHLKAGGKGFDSQYKDYISKVTPRIVEDILFGVSNDVYGVQSVPAAGWMIMRKTLMTVGGFDPIFFHYGEDDHYASRMKYHKLEFAIVPNARMIHDREEFGSNLAYTDQYFRTLKTHVFLNINLSKKEIFSRVVHILMSYTWESAQKVVKGNLKGAWRCWAEFSRCVLLLPRFRADRHRNKAVGSTWL